MSVRSDITVEDGLTPGEDLTLRWEVTDPDGQPESSFSGWQFTFFWLNRLSDANGVTALQAASRFTKTLGSGLSATAPNVDVTLSAADTAGLSASRPYAYELWRSDAGNQRRLAYGTIQFNP